MTAILGVVLAAGAGRRYGIPKVAVANGAWLNQAVLALTEGGVPHVLVALGAAVVPVPPPATPLLVSDWQRGLSATVTAAIHAAQAQPATETLVLHTVDTPSIGADVVKRVLRSDRGGLTRAVYHGRPGHPVMLGQRYWEPLLMQLSGDAGAGQFLAQHPDLVEVECGDLADGQDVDEK